MNYTGPTELYIDGEWTAAESGETIETLDPATEDVYATVESAGRDDVDRAVQAAEVAAERNAEWRSLDPKERAASLHAMADEIEARKEEIMTVEARDNGKTKFEAKLDLEMVIDTFRYFAGWADKVEGETIPVPGNRLDYTLREPLGVTAHIVPWNYPFQLAGRSLAPALACGNTAIIKPSSTTPLTALYYAVAAEEAGIPDGVVNVIPGSGRAAGGALAEHEGVDHITFTGGNEVGTGVMEAAASRAADVTLELGGKGPNVVFPDADLEAAANGCHYGIFMNAGQMCWAGSRLVVHEDVHDEVVDQVVEGAESTPLGSGIDDDARMGPLVSEQHQNDVLSYIQTGVDEGATLATGGGVPEGRETGFFVEPTVFTDVTNDMTIAQEEIFGPVLSVITFSDREEAIEIANDSPYGLMAGIWSSDIDTALETARNLDYGMVSINEYPQTYPQTPFGGYKESGLGREQGREAVQEMTQVKNVNVKISPE